MPSVKERLAEAREHHPGLDHTLAMQEHYGAVKAGQQAGAVTYFAFLSFFPVLALSVFSVGLLSRIYAGADDDLVTAIDSVLPGIIGPGENQVSLDDVRSFSGLAGLLGLVGVLYSGLGWVSALRAALVRVFDKSEELRLSFVVGKLRDLVALVVVGLVLIVAVAVAGFVSGFSAEVLDSIGLDSELGWLVRLVALALGLAANAVLFFALFRLLADPALPTTSLWSGAVLGAAGFEILKQVSGLLLASTEGQPAFQAFGIALILLVWINYFSRLVLYAAAWAYTTSEARALRVDDEAPLVQGPTTPPLLPSVATPTTTRTWVAPFAAGGAAALALVALVRKRS
ncbi:MAG: YihY/virulence factor BrkB family protein [Nocardioides sp.]